MSTVSLHRSSRERTSPSQVGVLLPPPLPGHTLSPFSPHLSGFLLDLATVVGSVGVTVQEATIQGDAEFCPTCKVAEGHDFEKGGRVFRCSIGAGLGHGAISDHGWGVAVCMSSTTVLLHPHPCVGPLQVSALQGRSEAGEYPVPPEFLSDNPISSTFPSLFVITSFPQTLRITICPVQSPGRVAAVFFILDLVAGKGYQPTRLD